MSKTTLDSGLDLAILAALLLAALVLWSRRTVDGFTPDDSDDATASDHVLFLREEPRRCNKKKDKPCRDDACCAGKDLKCHPDPACVSMCDDEGRCEQVYRPPPGYVHPTPSPHKKKDRGGGEGALESSDKAAQALLLDEGSDLRKPSSTDRIFAPYAESWKTFNLERTPVKNVVLAFLLSKGGKLAFDGSMPLSTMKPLADAVRKRGGRVILSFGGATGTELARDVSSVDTLVARYLEAAKEFGSEWLDFDIEGASVQDTAANTRRNKALAKLQQAVPAMYVSYTLGVMPTGLEEGGLALLRDAKAQGVRVGCVNIMAMDYGDSFGGDMGQYAIQAAKSTRAQLGKLGMASTKVGITPMIGKNDNGPRPFSLEDAQEVVSFAKATPWVGLLAFWALGRDNGRKSGLDDSSMLTQQDWAFSKIFSEYR